MKTAAGGAEARPNAARPLLRLCLAAFFGLAACVAAAAQAQAERLKEKAPDADAAQAQETSRPPASQPPTAAPETAATADAIDDGEVVRIESNLVSIPALVFTPSGNSVNDLRLEDFELRVDGEKKLPGELNRAETPVRMAVLFDNSASLTAARKFEKQAAVRFFTRVMRPVDQAALYSISTTPLLVRPLTSDVRTLVRTVEGFPEPEGATALFDSIAQAAKYLSASEGRKVIVIVSDGADTVSELSFDQALQQTLGADCQVYVVATRQLESPNFRDPIADRRLQVFTAQTGGAVYEPQSLEELDAAFERIAYDLSQQYVLNYYPTDDPTDGRFRTISLSVVTRQGLRVRARRGYFTAVGQARVRPRRVRGERGRTPSQEAARAAVTLDPAAARANATPSANGTPSDAVTNTLSLRVNAPRESARPPQVGPADSIEQSANATVTPSQAAATTAEPEPSPASPAQQLASAFVTPTTAQTPPPATPTPDPTPTPAARLTPPQAPAIAQGPPPTLSTEEKPAPTPGPPAPISGGVLNSRAISLPKPVYPQAAKTAGIRGSVTVEVLIDESGKVVSARAVVGPAVLQAAAAAAARQARFSPTTLSGQPVKVSGVITYNFILP